MIRKQSPDTHRFLSFYVWHSVTLSVHSFVLKKKKRNLRHKNEEDTCGAFFKGKRKIKIF